MLLWRLLDPLQTHLAPLPGWLALLPRQSDPAVSEWARLLSAALAARSERNLRMEALQLTQHQWRIEQEEAKLSSLHKMFAWVEQEVQRCEPAPPAELSASTADAPAEPASAAEATAPAASLKDAAASSAASDAALLTSTNVHAHLSVPGAAASHLRRDSAVSLAMSDFSDGSLDLASNTESEDEDDSKAGGENEQQPERGAATLSAPASAEAASPAAAATATAEIDTQPQEEEPAQEEANSEHVTVSESDDDEHEVLLFLLIVV